MKRIRPELTSAKGSTAGARAWGRLPHSVTRDRLVTALELVALAFRLTFADDRRSYGLSTLMLARGVRSGFGRDSGEQAIAGLKNKGFLVRHQPPPIRREGKFYAQRAVDRVALPESAAQFQVVRRDWFDGTLSVDEVAVLLFVRAGTGLGPFVFGREFQDRFGWGRERCRSAIRGLLARKLIVKDERRQSDGRFGGSAYRSEAGLLDPQHTKVASSGRRSPGCREGGHKRSNPEPKQPPPTISRCARPPPKAAEPETFDPMGWVDDDNAAQTMVRDTPDYVFEEVAEAASDQELRRAVIHACDGRVSKKLLTADGLDSVRCLAAFVLWNSEEDHGPQDALRAVLGAMWDAVGSKSKNRRLNSLALIGSRIAADIYNYGDCHGGVFYRRSSR